MRTLTFTIKRSKVTIWTGDRKWTRRETRKFLKRNPDFVTTIDAMGNAVADGEYVREEVVDGQRWETKITKTTTTKPPTQSRSAVIADLQRAAEPDWPI